MTLIRSLSIAFGVSLLCISNFISSLERNYILEYSSLVPSLPKLLLPSFIIVIVVMLCGLLIFLSAHRNVKKNIGYNSVIVWPLLFFLSYLIFHGFLSIASLQWKDVGVIAFGGNFFSLKAISFLWEILLVIAIAFFIYFKKKSTYALIKFIGFSGYIIFFFFVIKHLPYFDWKSIDSPSSNNVTSGLISSKQVIWIIFDEFDPQIAFNDKNTKSLSTFRQLKDSGVYNSLSIPPGDATLYSIPATLMGTGITGYEIVGNQKLELIDSNGHRIPFQFKGSFFDILVRSGHESSIFGVYHPYCMVFKGLDCKEVQPFDVPWHYGVTKFPLKFLDTYIPQLNPLSASESGNILAVQLDGLFNFIRQKKQDLLFIHIVLPHLPALAAKKYFNKYDYDSSLINDYELNLQYADIILKDFLGSIPDDGRERLLILSSDHWFRSLSPSNPRPALWIGKLMSDVNGIENSSISSSIHTPELILDFFAGKIKSNKDINSFFMGKDSPLTYMDATDKKVRH